MPDRRSDVKRSRKTPMFLRILLPLLSGVFCLASIEVVARIWEYNLAQSSAGWELVGAAKRLRLVPVNNAEIGFMVQPNEDYFWEGIPIHINSNGVRDEEWDLEKSDGTFRILNVGDSITFGWEVREEDRYGEQLVALLESRLGVNVEVLNAGVPRWRLLTEYAFIRDVGFTYRPDLVIVEFTVFNDVEDCHEEFPQQQSLSQWLRDNTAAWGFLSGLLRSPLPRPPEREAVLTDSLPSYPFPLDENDPLWEECVTTPLMQMSELVATYDSQFIFVVFPIDMQVRSAEFPRLPQQIVEQIGAEHRIMVLDLLPLYRANYVENPDSAEEDSDNPLFADFYSHPSPLGHRLAAEAIVQLMEQAGLFRGSGPAGG